MYSGREQQFADFTAGARDIVESVTLDDCFQPEFWKEQLPLVCPRRAMTKGNMHARPRNIIVGRRLVLRGLGLDLEVARIWCCELAQIWKVR